MMLMCPHCGWKYDPLSYTMPGDDGRPFALVPSHALHAARDMSALALEHGADSEECPGSDQHPRNPEADRRPLWKDIPAKPTF